jgi:uncharacterized membrane protein
MPGLAASAVIYLWLTRSPETVISKIARVRLARARTLDRILTLLVAVFIGCFTVAVVLRYNALASSIDLGQYAQLVWNSLNGRLLEGTFVPDAPIFLGKSFTPILLAFVPLYAVLPNPIVLSIVQIVGFGFGAYPIYWFARERIGRVLALGIATAYLACPVVVNSALIEFHEIALATPLLALAMYLLARNKHSASLAVFGVTLLIKEELALVLAGIGLYTFIFQRKRRLGLALTAFSLLWAVVLLQHVIPFFRGTAPGTFYYFAGGVIAGGASRYGYLGNSLSSVVTTIVTRPDIVVSQVLVPTKIDFVLHLFVPLLLLPLFDPLWLLALPTLGYSLLSTYPGQFTIANYYSTPLLPFLYLASASGLAFLRARVSLARIPMHVWNGTWLAGLLVVSASNYYLNTFAPFARGFVPADYALTSHRALGHSLIDAIPANAVVVAQDEFLTALAQRQFVYEIPLAPDMRQVDYLFVDRQREWFSIHRGYWEHFLATGIWEPIIDQDGYVLAGRRPLTPLTPIHFGDQFTLLGYALAPATAVRDGMPLYPMLEWRMDSARTQNYQIVLSVFDVQGHQWASLEREWRDGKIPTREWQTDKRIVDFYELALPPTMPPGDYQLGVQVYAKSETGNQFLNARMADQSLGDEITVTSFRVERSHLPAVASDLPIERPQYVDMREMRFLGTTDFRATIQPGETLSLGLYWRARAKPQGDYFAVVQLRDANGHIAFEQAARPANGAYPTTQWNEGEVLLDWHDLQLPSNLRIGDYQIIVSLRDTAGLALGTTVISSISVIQ